jgi:type IV secretory pathway VirJ component
MPSMAMILLLAVLHLPLIEKPVSGASPFFVLLLTGDGGWRGIDAGVAEELNREGFPVAGFLSDDYFAEGRSPTETGRDVGAAIEHYAELWKKEKVILIGYSRGADAVPIALLHMSPTTRTRVALAALLGPSRSAELQTVPFWKSATVPSIALAPIMRQLRGLPLVCVHGADEDASLCDVLPQGAATDMRMPGGHHFGGRYAEIAKRIVASLPKR